MTRNTKILVWCACLTLLALRTQSSNAKDFGVRGELFKIEEVDMVKYIKDSLLEMERDGRLKLKQLEMHQRSKKYVERPNSVIGVSHTVKPKSWLFDPSYILAEDIKDQDGKVIHKAGTVINPLDKYQFNTQLVFIDGDSQEQIDWALANREANKIVLVNGAPMKLMKKYKTRLYFDQKSILVQRFGLSHVPALVKQKDKNLLIEEILLQGEADAS